MELRCLGLFRGLTSRPGLGLYLNFPGLSGQSNLVFARFLIPRGFNRLRDRFAPGLPQISFVSSVLDLTPAALETAEAFDALTD